MLLSCLTANLSYRVLYYITLVLSRGFTEYLGNGKRDCTPTPVRLSKIKRVSFKGFLCLKALLRNFKPRDEKKTRRYRKRQIVSNHIEAARQEYAQSYEPTNIASVYDSLSWRWHRVAEWERYINDSLDKKRARINHGIMPPG